MARYQIVIAYDGSDFLGSQRQAKSRTVQSQIERALKRLGWQGKSVIMAGRTDTGVHALGQVAAFDYEWNHSPDDLASAINGNLPADIVVETAKLVHDEFHPRFDALTRRYCYRLLCQPVRKPLQERYIWRVWPMPDETILHQAASLFLGRHDFAAFGSPAKAGNSTIRTVMKSNWQISGDEWTFEVEADGFLYRMVRKLVHIQVAVGQGRFSAQLIADALAGKCNLPAGLAPAKGLALVEVTYPVV
jgi:tRNA pseudouridine38-40 synthase